VRENSLNLTYGIMGLARTERVLKVKYLSSRVDGLPAAGRIQEGDLTNETCLFRSPGGKKEAGPAKMTMKSFLYLIAGPATVTGDQLPIFLFIS